MSLMLMNTGDQRLVRPSFGSWLNYGMGTENQNLPGFIALCPGGLPVGGAGNWRSAFLPGAYQGTHVDTSKSDPKDLIANVHNDRMSQADQLSQFQLLQRLNARHLRSTPPRSGPRSTDSIVRTCLPHADRGNRRVRHLAGTAIRVGPVRRHATKPTALVGDGGLLNAAFDLSRRGMATCSHGTATKTSSRPIGRLPTNAIRDSPR